MGTTIFIGVLLLIILILAILALTYRRMASNANNVTSQSLAQLANAQSTARAYLDAAKLIRIDRTGRLNVFTFARQDQLFTIQTMGIWDDTPDLWREQAGLVPPANSNTPQG